MEVGWNPTSQVISALFQDFQLETSEKVFETSLIDWGGGVEKPSSGYL